MTRKTPELAIGLSKRASWTPIPSKSLNASANAPAYAFFRKRFERGLSTKKNCARCPLAFYRVPHHRPRHCDCTQICHPLDTVPYCDITPEYPSCYPRPSCHCSNRRSRKQTPTESNWYAYRTRGSSLRRIAQPNLRRSGISILFYRQYLARSACRRSASRDRRRTVAGP